MKAERILAALAAVLAAMSLAACGVTPQRPMLPDGEHRMPANPPQHKLQTTEPVSAVDAIAPARKSFVWRPQLNQTVTEPVEVMAVATLYQIAANTHLRLLDELDDDVRVLIHPGEDPMNVLGQIAQQAPFAVELDREAGRLNLRPGGPVGGLNVLRDAEPVTQIGDVVDLPTLPQSPVPLSEALQLLAPAGFDIGFEENIDRNILVDVSRIQGWRQGLQAIALQTPYRVVCDWTQKLLYVTALRSRTASVMTTPGQ